MVPTDNAAYRRTIGHFATGVTVVTTVGPAGPAGLTTNAVTSLSLDPVLAIVCLDRGSRTLAAVRETRRLAVNVLTAEQHEVAVTFAGKASHAEKFRDVGYRTIDGAAVLHGALAWFTGEVRELLPGGDHEIAVVEVRSCAVEGGEPLLFYDGGYRALP
jgi:flavin reductase (DIM6/NTAB) family NADH-FMN oxidoreductase RutF